MVFRHPGLQALGMLGWTRPEAPGAAASLDPSLGACGAVAVVFLGVDGSGIKGSTKPTMGEYIYI